MLLFINFFSYSRKSPTNQIEWGRWQKVVSVLERLLSQVPAVCLSLPLHLPGFPLFSFYFSFHLALCLLPLPPPPHSSWLPHRRRGTFWQLQTKWMARRDTGRGAAPPPPLSAVFDFQFWISLSLFPFFFCYFLATPSLPLHSPPALFVSKKKFQFYANCCLKYYVSSWLWRVARFQMMANSLLRTLVLC